MWTILVIPFQEILQNVDQTISSISLFILLYTDQSIDPPSRPSDHFRNTKKIWGPLFVMWTILVIPFQEILQNVDHTISSISLFILLYTDQSIDPPSRPQIFFGIQRIFWGPLFVKWTILGNLTKCGPYHLQYQHFFYSFIRPSDLFRNTKIKLGSTFCYVDHSCNTILGNLTKCGPDHLQYQHFYSFIH